MIVAAFLVQTVGVDLAGQKQHRHRISPGFGDTREGISRAGAGGGANDTELTGDACVAVSQKGSRLFVANQNGADAAVACEGVINTRDMRARHAKQDTHSLLV